MLSIISYAVFFIFCIISLYDLKRGVALWAAWRIIIGNSNVCLKYTEPAVTLDLAISFMMLLFYIFKKKGKNYYKNYPYKNIYHYLIISYSISAFVGHEIFSYIESDVILRRTIKYFLINFIFLYLFYVTIQDAKYFKLFIRNFCVAILVFPIYGIQEYFTHINPLNQLIIDSVPPDILRKQLSFTGEYEPLRRGQSSIQSVFPLHIAYGCAAVMCSFFLFTIKGIIKKKIYIVALFSLIVSAFICTSKTSMLGVLCMSLVFINKKFLAKPKNVLFLFIGFLLILPIASVYIDALILTFQGADTAQVEGSNVVMRLGQAEESLKIFAQSPIFGYGMASVQFLQQHYGILGLESSMLVIPINYGIVGLFGYFYMYHHLYKCGVKYIGKWLLFVFLFTMIVMEFATGLMDFSLEGIIYLSILRYSKSSLMEKEYLCLK